MMNLPTGLGKSIISYVLALVLNRETKKKVLLVTQTKFGKHTGYNRYAVGEQSAKYPSPLLGTKVVWHITFQELAMVADKINCEDYICIIDEVD
jgi:Rad3-related DNA helicase